jgi:hypothetical protein
MTAIETSEPSPGTDAATDVAPAPAPPGAAAPASRERTVTLTIAAFASLAAGAIHATAIGSHSGLPDVVTAFTITAAFQLGWGAVALVWPARAPIALGLAGNLAFFAGWVVAMTSGITFIEGLDTAGDPSRADVIAAALALVAVVGSALAILRPRLGLGRHTVLLAVAGIACVALGTVGMAAAGDPDHHGSGEAADGHAHGDDAAAGDHGDGHVEAQPFDPALPIDLSGTPGVTPEQQAAAENMISASLISLPHWEDYRVAEAEGFSSIGDGATGSEHFINWEYAADDDVLNPARPESLMYDTTGGGRRLVAAMYMTEPGLPLTDVPEFGGALTQWHIHDNLCFFNPPDGTGARVGGVIPPDQDCPDGLFRFPATPMIHVWITSHPCGPFAALEGIGGGQILEGEERLCDTAHGH